MIDLNNLKEELLSFLRNASNSLANSSAFFFLKEKYYHLNPLYRKILQTGVWLVLSAILLYYPVSLLYSSMGYVKDFNTKQKLLQDLLALSAGQSSGASLFYSQKSNMVSLIRQKARAMQIPEKQIKRIQKASLTARTTGGHKITDKGSSLRKPPSSKKKALKPKIGSQKLALSAKGTAVEVVMEKLNLQEVVQYGHQMEQFSKNIKLMGIHIQEDIEKKNYFNVSYILHIFSRIQAKDQNQKGPIRI